ncbi:MAL1 Maltase, partial [Pseudoatta argentina]
MDNEKLADREWWETTLIYQIWPRGFQDSDGDGEGDLKGIISRLDYITDLGIETICLNPIYVSPLIDSGYDVSNYTDIDPLFGNLDDFDNLMREAHNRGLKVILDIIPNHSSDQHKWFQLSAKNVQPYTDYYIWTNGINKNGKNIPPNNWAFIRDIFDFWLERNVDGFRINAVPYFFEDKALRNESFVGRNIYTFGLPESTALLYVFREHIDNWVSRNNATSKLLIAESYDISDDNLLAYYGNSTHKGIAPFNFKFITHIRDSSNATYIKHVLEKWLKLLPKYTKTNWVLSNHDNSRVASRIGLNRIDGLHMLSLLLPGQAYTYYGEEIAMLDTKILWNSTIDPMGCARGINEYKYFSRDPARTPMQWSSKSSAGFSVNKTTYLPIHLNYVNRNVEIQQNRKRSNLKTYKKLAILRKQSVFTDGDYEFASLNNDRVLVLKRSFKNYPVYFIVINLGLRQEKINLTSIHANLQNTLNIIVASSNAIRVTGTVPWSNFILTANAAVVLKSGEGQEQTTPVITINVSTENTSLTTEESVSTINTSLTTKVTSPTEKSTESTTKKEEENSTTESDNNAILSCAPAFLLIISSIVISYKF